LGGRHERLETAQDFAAFLQRDGNPFEPGNDCGIGDRRFSFPVGLDRNVVAQIGAQIVEVAFFLGHGDQPAVAVSERDFDSEDRGDLSIGLIFCGAT
jgi:hypothetical protein